jgi:hypothetical protein
VPVLLILLVAPARATAFGIESFTITARNADGTIDELAGTHPFSLEVHAGVNTGRAAGPEEPLRRVEVSLPPGLVGSALDVPRCSAVSPASCSGSDQVGVLRGIVAGLGQVTAPIYNLAPELGHAAAFGVTINGESFIQRLSLAGVGAGSSIRLSGSVSPGLGLTDIDEQIWGVPADPGHDPERICRSSSGELIEGCPSGAEPMPLLTLPGSCSGPMVTTLTATSFGPSPVTAVATALSRDAGENPRSLVGCEGVPFDSRLTVQSEAAALAPSALGIGIEVPQYEGSGVTAAAFVTELEIKLPEGLALNPTAGSWLSSCSPAAIGLESTAGAEPPAFDEKRAECPASSRFGSVKLRTPLVDHELDGAIYLATPTANPFDARYAIYLVVEDEATGTILKIPGRLDADPNDGRLTATIPELPQFPFEELELEFSGGSRAPLVSPPECGRYTTEATFTPSTAPFGSVITRSGGFTLDRGSGGKPCPPPEAERNTKPSFQAGTTMPVAGAAAPLVVKFSREDTDQHLGSFELTLPPGLLANLGGVSVGTEVGSARVEAGVGPEPLRLDGTVYLGGPYKGDPYSLTIVVPAQAGPFDLGTIVERVAVNIDPATAQISVHSDPLPQILDGMPLQLRGLRIDLDRPGFIRNPTSCEPMAISGSATSSLGQTAPLSMPFQVGECARLRFRPKLSLRLTGALGRNGHPGVRAVMSGAEGEATPVSAGFTLPADELLDLGHIRDLCPRGAKDDQCPPSSRLGSVRLESPFLAEPLTGMLYLRVPSHRLPALSAELHSGSLGFVLHGRTTDSHGRVGVSLESLPDIPFSQAVFSLAGGRSGIVVNSRSLCSSPARAAASFVAHSGKRRKLRLRPPLGGHC